MSFLKNIKLQYSTKILNQCIDNQNFTDFEEHFNNIKKLDPNIANQYLRYNADKFIDVEDLSYLFNDNIIWANSFNPEDAVLASNIVSQIISNTSNLSIKNFNFYQEVLSALNDKELEDYSTVNDIFLKSHYYFQILVNNKNPYLKTLNTSSAFFEYNKNTYFTHSKLTKCFIYIIKHPYKIFDDLRQSGYESNEIINLLCGLDDKPLQIHSEQNNKTKTCQEQRKSWAVNVSSWTNENVQNSLRGLIINFDDLLSNLEDKLIEIAGHLKESGIVININPQELNKLASTLQINNKHLNEIEISNKDKKIIDRDCGELIAKYF